MQVRFTAKSEIGKVRTHQEDSWGVDEDTPNGKLYVVCDGMGGHVGGATASRLAVTSILEYFKRKKYDNLIQHIDKAFEFANEQIFAHTLADPSLKGMGTTAVILIIKKDECYIGHVGDSRIYIKTQSKLHRLTKDHSFVQELVSQGVITDDEAETHPKKNQILRALGHSSNIEGTVCKRPFKVKAGDTFMLCSDGLNGMVNDAVMESMINGNELNQSQERLYQAAMANGGNDNITIILINVTESNYYGKSDFQSFNPVQRGRYDEDDSLSKTSTFNTTETPYRKRSKKNKFLVPVLSVLVILSISFGSYQYFSNIKEPVISDDGPIKKIVPKTIDELTSMKSDQLEKAAKERIAVTGIDEGDQEITTSDQKKFTILISDDRLVDATIKDDRNEDTQVSEKPDKTNTITEYTRTSVKNNDNDKDKDKDKDNFKDNVDKCPDLPGKHNGCPCENPDKSSKPVIGINRDGTFNIAPNKEGETIGKLIERIKKFGCNPGDKEQLLKLNPNISETDTLKGKIRINFKCIDCK